MNNKLVNTTSVKIVHGGPTTGKSTVSALLSKLGVNVIDTDLLTVEVDPDYFKLKKWEAKDPVGLAHIAEVHRQLGNIVYEQLSANERSLCLTNLHSGVFFDPLKDFLVNGLIPVGCFRSTAEDIVKLSESREGSKLPLSLTSKWVEGMRRDASSKFAKFYWLDAGEYLIDVLIREEIINFGGGD
jgi:hypothetical protein